MAEATPDEDADAFLAAFLQQRLADRQRGAEASLEEYCRRFPGREHMVRAAWAESATIEHLGHFRLLHLLGRGGQGEVWLAEDTRLGRQVAVKVLRSLALTSVTGLERFRREAAVASRLDHPGICAIYDVGTADGVPYLVMRYVDGVSLASAIASRPTAARPDAVEVRRIAGIVERLARALHAAHEAGVLHRDVKPQNVMLTCVDQPVLLDFGLARLIEDEAMFTRTGEVFGTPAYLAPEALATPPAAPDCRADIYALGVTLYECLCGARPFAAPTRAALYQQVLAAAPTPVRRLNVAVPAELAIVVQAAMERDPRRRYASAAALADDLQRWREHRPILARELGLATRLRRWYQRSPAFALAMGGLLLSLSIGLAVSLRWWRTAVAEQQRASTLLGEWESLADGRRLEELVAEADRELWPAEPVKVAAMDAWLQRADSLVSRLPEHQRVLAELRRAAHGSADQPEFANPETAWRCHQLELLVRGVEAFAANEVFATTLASVRQRRQWALQVQRCSINDAHDAWLAAAARVHEHPAYRGLTLTPQLGLVPIGADPASGFEEFADLETGVVPERAADGRLRYGVDAAVVFVLLPGGSFLMGSQKTDPEAPNYDPDAQLIEFPVHELRLAPFLLSKFELTQGQWQRTMGDNPSSIGPGQSDRRAVVDLRHPVENVSWNRCAEFLLHRGWSFPTEAQWEYACRAGGHGRWSCGSDAQELMRFANLGDEASRPDFPGDWRSEPGDDGHSVHAPVGSYLPNAFGLYDMHGNVGEWCLEPMLRYDNPTTPGTGRRLSIPVAESRAAKSLVPLRAFRGGNYAVMARAGRAARRDQERVEANLHLVGLRPARLLH